MAPRINPRAVPTAAERPDHARLTPSAAARGVAGCGSCPGPARGPATMERRAVRCGGERGFDECGDCGDRRLQVGGVARPRLPGRTRPTASSCWGLRRTRSKDRSAGLRGAPSFVVRRSRGSPGPGGRHRIRTPSPSHADRRSPSSGCWRSRAAHRIELLGHDRLARVGQQAW